MADLTERLLNPATMEAALKELYLFSKDSEFLVTALRELHRRAEQYRQNWLSLQNATGEECHLRALEVIREIPELHARLATAKAEGAAEALEKLAQEIDAETAGEEFFRGVLTTADMRDRAAEIRKQVLNG